MIAAETAAVDLTEIATAAAETVTVAAAVTVETANAVRNAPIAVNAAEMSVVSAHAVLADKTALQSPAINPSVIIHAGLSPKTAPSEPPKQIPPFALFPTSVQENSRHSQIVP